MKHNTQHPAKYTLDVIEGVALHQQFPIDRIGLTTESFVGNFTRHPIHAIDPNGVKTCILPNDAMWDRTIDHIVINHRITYIRRPVDAKSKGIKEVKQYTFKISVDALHYGPVFIPELGMMYCNDSYEHSAVNPASLRMTGPLMDNLLDEMAKDALSAPVVIVANDPRQIYKNLYVIINGVIMSTLVTNYTNGDEGPSLETGEGETDGIALYRRISERGSTLRVSKIDKTSFAHIERMPGKVWHVDGWVISPNRDMLVEILEKAKVKQASETISTKDHFDRMEEQETRLKALHMETLGAKERIIDGQVETERALTREIKTLKMQLTQATESQYSDRHAEIEELKIRLAEEQARQAPREAELKRQHEAEMQRKEREMQDAANKSKRSIDRYKILTAMLGFVTLIIGNWKHIAPLFKKVPVPA